MSILDKTLPLDVPIAMALAWAGTYAMKEGRGEAALATRELAGLLDGATVPTHVTIRTILCCACDHYRAQNKPEIVEHLEKVIALLQEGCPPRVVHVGLNMGTTPAMLAKIVGA
jgi:hypothetical protein